MQRWKVGIYTTTRQQSIIISLSQIQLSMHLLRNLLLNKAPLTFRASYFRSTQKAQKDLYQLLGVSRTADPKEIKKAYYKLAQEYHPDKNQSADAKEKFTEINNAYQILSDPSKRQMYDQTGQTGEGNAAGYNNFHGNGQGFNPEDIFGQFKGFKQGGQNMGGFEDIFGDLFGGGFQQRANRGQQSYDSSPITMSMVLTFQESVKGTKKILEYERKSICSTCNGSRAKPGTEPQKCRSCDGSGMQSFRQGMFVMKSTCEACAGEGVKIKHHCGTCSGKGFERKKAREEVDIPRGISDGMTIKLTGKGNFSGDVYLKMQIKKSPVFQRAGINALSELKISVLDAILGAEKEVQTIEGGKKSVRVPAGIQSGQTVTLSGEGFHMVNSSNKGDHIITVKIEIPKQLSVEERQLYEKLRELSK